MAAVTFCQSHPFMLALLASAWQCSAAVPLAGLAETSLPVAQPMPNWAGGSSSRAQVYDFRNPEVEKWRESNTFANPTTESMGWRLVPQGYLKGQPWCLRRIKFLSRAGTEIAAGSYGCILSASGSKKLAPEYLAQHAFEDTNRDGCVLSDSEVGVYHFGLVCEQFIEVEQIQVIQANLAQSSASVKVQQLQKGLWVDVGNIVTMPIGASKVIFVAATCALGVCSGEYAAKAGARLPKVCQHRACSLWECCDKKDTCKTETCTTPQWGLKANAEGTRCAGTTCDEYFCCEEKGICSTSTCGLSNMYVKAFPPMLCQASVCTTEECCETPKCSADICVSGGGLLKKKAKLPFRCVNAYCLVAECCDPYTAVTTGQPECEESICTTAGFKFQDLAFGKECAGVACTAAECCVVTAPPGRLWEVPFGHKQGKGDAGLAFRPDAGSCGVAVMVLLAVVARVAFMVRGSPGMQDHALVCSMVDSESGGGPE